MCSGFVIVWILDLGNFLWFIFGCCWVLLSLIWHPKTFYNFFSWLTFRRDPNYHSYFLGLTFYLAFVFQRKCLLLWINLFFLWTLIMIFLLGKKQSSYIAFPELHLTTYLIRLHQFWYCFVKSALSVQKSSFYKFGAFRKKALLLFLFFPSSSNFLCSSFFWNFVLFLWFSLVRTIFWLFIYKTILFLKLLVADHHFFSNSETTWFLNNYNTQSPLVFEKQTKQLLQLLLGENMPFLKFEHAIVTEFCNFCHFSNLKNFEYITIMHAWELDVT